VCTGTLGLSSAARISNRDFSYTPFLGSYLNTSLIIISSCLTWLRRAPPPMKAL
jgi:hypothetical protein